MLICAPATAEDIKAFYGEVGPTIKAVCVRRDGEPVLIVGLAMEKKQARFFSENRMSPQERRSVTAWRAVKQSMSIVKNNLTPVVAIAECQEGFKNLERLGFSKLVDNVYVWGDSWHS